MYWPGYFFIIILTGVVFNDGYQLNKCCPKNKSFNTKLECNFNNNISDINDVSYWKSNHNITIQDYKLPCNKFSLKLYFLDNFNTTIIKDMLYADNLYFNTTTSVCVDRWNIWESDEDGEDVVFQDIIIICPCIEYGCIWKCCLPGYHIVDEVCEPHDSLQDWHYSMIYNSTFNQLHQLHHVVQCHNKHRLYLTGDYIVQEDGRILSQIDGEMASDQYCGDFVLNPNSTRIPSVIACVNKVTDIHQWLYGSLCIVATVFLIATLFVLLAVPGEWGRAGFALFSHTCCLAVATFITAINHFEIQPERSLFCFVLGFGMQSSYLSSFCWLSVLCWLMGSSFTGVRAPRTPSHTSPLGYHILCWTTTLLLTTIALLADFTTILPEKSYLRPNIGLGKCWFHSRGSLWLYFYGPLTILLLGNICLFLYTTHRVATLGRERLFLRRQGSVTSEQQRYLVYVKLFTLMGALWILEVVGWLCEGEASWWKWVWILPDCLNLLRSVFLLMLVLNKSRVRRHLRSTFSLRSSTTTTTTGTTTACIPTVTALAPSMAPSADIM